MARRDDREYRKYLREEQRSQRGCIAVRMQMELHHGLLEYSCRLVSRCAPIVYHGPIVSVLCASARPLWWMISFRRRTSDVSNANPMR